MLGIAAALVGCASQQPRPDRQRDLLRLRYQMAESLVEQHAYDSAVPYLMDLVGRNPRDARLHLLLGLVLRDKGIYPKAEQELKLALKLSPNSDAVHAAMGILHLKQRRFAAASASLRRAVELAPRVASHRNDLGFCLLVQRKLDPAREQLLEAIRLDPTSRLAFNNLGMVLGLMGQEQQALDAFGQAGSRPMALTNMGFVQELRGRPVAARRYYERALRLQHDYAPAQHNLSTLDPQNPAFIDDEEDR